MFFSIYRFIWATSKVDTIHTCRLQQQTPVALLWSLVSSAVTGQLCFLRVTGKQVPKLEHWGHIKTMTSHHYRDIVKVGISD